MAGAPVLVVLHTGTALPQEDLFHTGDLPGVRIPPGCGAPDAEDAHTGDHEALDREPVVYRPARVQGPSCVQHTITSARSTAARDGREPRRRRSRPPALLPCPPGRAGFGHGRTRRWRPWPHRSEGPLCG